MVMLGNLAPAKGGTVDENSKRLISTKAGVKNLKKKMKEMKEMRPEKKELKQLLSTFYKYTNLRSRLNLTKRGERE